MADEDDTDDQDDDIVSPSEAGGGGDNEPAVGRRPSETAPQTSDISQIKWDDEPRELLASQIKWDDEPHEEQRGTVADIGVGALQGFVRGAGELTAPVFKAGALLTSDDPKNSWLYKQGQATKEFADKMAEYLPSPQTSAGKFASDVFGGVAQIAPVVVSPLVGAVLMGAGGVTRQGEGALEKTGQTSTGALLAGGATGVAEGVAIAKMGKFLGPVLKTVEGVAPALTGWARSVLLGAAREGVVLTGIDQADEILQQQIAKTFYDPEAGYHPDVQRLLTTLATGAIVGGVRGAVEHAPTPAAKEPIPGVSHTDKASPSAGGPGSPARPPQDFSGPAEAPPGSRPLRQIDQPDMSPRPGPAQELAGPTPLRPIGQPDQTQGGAPESMRGRPSPLRVIDQPDQTRTPAPADPTQGVAVENTPPKTKGGAPVSETLTPPEGSAQEYPKNNAVSEQPPVPTPDLNAQPQDIKAATDALNPPKEVMPNANGSKPDSGTNVATPPREGPTPPPAATAKGRDAVRLMYPEKPKFHDALLATGHIMDEVQGADGKTYYRYTRGTAPTATAGMYAARNAIAARAAIDAAQPAPKEAMPNARQQPVPANNVTTPPAATADGGLDIPGFLRRPKGNAAPDTQGQPSPPTPTVAEPKRDFNTPKGGIGPEGEKILAEREAVKQAKNEAKFAELAANREAKKRQDDSFKNPAVNANTPGAVWHVGSQSYRLPKRTTKAQAAIDAAAGKTNPEPTPEQAESGNYKKGTADFQGLKVDIETPRGAMRKGVGADGQPWEVPWDRGANDKMNADRAAYKPQPAREEDIGKEASESQLSNALKRFKGDEVGSVQIPKLPEDPHAEAIRELDEATVPLSLPYQFTHTIGKFAREKLGLDAPDRIRNSWEGQENRRQRYTEADTPTVQKVAGMSSEAQDVFNRARVLNTDPSLPYNDKNQPKSRDQSEAAREHLHEQTQKLYEALGEKDKADIQELRQHIGERETGMAEDTGVNRVMGKMRNLDRSFAERVRDGKETPEDIAKHGQEFIDELRELFPPGSKGGTYLPFLRPGKHSVMALRPVPERPIGAEQATDADGKPVAKYTFKTEEERTRFDRQMVDEGHNIPTNREFYVDKDGNTINPETKHPFTAGDAKDDPELSKRYQTDLDLLHHERFDTRKDANRAREDYKNSGRFEVTDVQPARWQPGRKSTTNDAIEHAMDEALRRSKLYQTLDPTAKAAFKDILIQTKLDSMGGTAITNPRMHRLGVSGWSNDLLRSYMHWSEESAHRRARLDFAPEETVAWRDLEEAAKPNTGDSKTSALRSAIRDEMARRKEALDAGDSLRDTLSGKLVSRLLQASQVARLATPRFLLQNSFQPSQRTGPWMMGEFGDSAITAYKNTFKAYQDLGIGTIFKQAGRDTVRALKGQTFQSSIFSDMLSNIRDPGERAFLTRFNDILGGFREAAQQGESPHSKPIRLDIGSGGNKAVNLAVGAGEHAVNFLDRGLTYLSNVAAPLNAAVELVNRTVSGLAVYRREMARSGDAAKATQKAFDAVNETQINYSKASEPPYMHQPGAAGAALRVPLQFKKYGMQTLGFIARSARHLASEDPQQRKAGMIHLGGIMATTILFAGAAGLPVEQIASPIMTGLKAAGFTDDDWRNIEMSVREHTAKALGQAFGLDEMGRPGRFAQKVTEVSAGGLPRLISWDATNNLGMNNMLTNGAPDYAKMGSKEWKANLDSWLFDMAKGSGGNLLGELYQMGAALTHGDIPDALEKTPVKMISDLTKAVEGYVGKGKSFQSERGANRLPSLTLTEATAKALGFKPASTSEAQTYKFGQSQKNKQEQGERSDAVTAYIKDPSGPNLAKAIQAGATPASIKAAMRNVAVTNAQDNFGIRSTKRSAEGDAAARSNYYLPK